ncbi:MAG: alpha/beta hydrolase family protein [Planctomycetota bacterium]|jgi:acetyl esterase/lipase
MKLRVFSLILLFFLLSTNIILAQVDSHSKTNGTIVEKISNLPYETYEQWIKDLKKQITFDEIAFRKQYPPEDFEKYKDAINCPFDTYEEWLRVLRRRWQGKASRNQIDEGEKRFRKEHPPEEFERFKKEIDYVKLKYMSDGFKVVCFILKPKSIDRKKLPVIIYNRGGHHEVAAVDFERLLSFHNLVSEGYILVASQYRGGPESEGQDEIGGADVNDVLSLIPVIESLPYADASRIGMFGWSRGGMMTYIALTKTTRISAAIIGAGPADLIKNVKKRTEMGRVMSRFVPNYEKNKKETLESRSAIYWAEKLHKGTPILLLQGSADKRCDPKDALRMAIQLYETKHPFRLVFFEDGDHGLSRYKKEVNDLLIGWFNKYLKGGKPLSNSAG